MSSTKGGLNPSWDIYRSRCFLGTCYAFMSPVSPIYLDFSQYAYHPWHLYQLGGWVHIIYTFHNLWGKSADIFGQNVGILAPAPHRKFFWDLTKMSQKNISPFFSASFARKGIQFCLFNSCSDWAYFNSISILQTDTQKLPVQILHCHFDNSWTIIKITITKLT